MAKAETWKQRVREWKQSGLTARQFADLVASAEVRGLNPAAYLPDPFRVLPHWPKSRILELAPLYWKRTRAGLIPEQLAWPIGPLTIPSALDLDAIRSEGRRLRELEANSG